MPPPPPLMPLPPPLRLAMPPHHPSYAASDIATADRPSSAHQPGHAVTSLVAEPLRAMPGAAGDHVPASLGASTLSLETPPPSVVVATHSSEPASLLCSPGPATPAWCILRRGCHHAAPKPSSPPCAVEDGARSVTSAESCSALHRAKQCTSPRRDVVAPCSVSRPCQARDAEHYLACDRPRPRDATICERLRCPWPQSGAPSPRRRLAPARKPSAELDSLVSVFHHRMICTAQDCTFLLPSPPRCLVSPSPASTAAIATTSAAGEPRAQSLYLSSFLSLPVADLV